MKIITGKSELILLANLDLPAINPKLNIEDRLIQILSCSKTFGKNCYLPSTLIMWIYTVVIRLILMYDENLHHLTKFTNFDETSSFLFCKSMILN